MTPARGMQVIPDLLKDAVKKAQEDPNYVGITKEQELVSRGRACRGGVSCISCGK